MKYRSLHRNLVISLIVVLLGVLSAYFLSTEFGFPLLESAGAVITTLGLMVAVFFGLSKEDSGGDMIEGDKYVVELGTEVFPENDLEAKNQIEIEELISDNTTSVKDFVEDGDSEWAFRIKSSVSEDIENLDEETRNRVQSVLRRAEDKIKNYRKTPGKRLQAKEHNLRIVKVGDYRIILSVKYEKKKATIIAISNKEDFLEQISFLLQ